MKICMYKVYAKNWKRVDSIIKHTLSTKLSYKLLPDMLLGFGRLRLENSYIARTRESKAKMETVL